MTKLIASILSLTAMINWLVLIGVALGGLQKRAVPASIQHHPGAATLPPCA
jgi:hypothetical protein